MNGHKRMNGQSWRQAILKKQQENRRRGRWRREGGKGMQKYWNEKYNWQKILFRFICKAEHSINFRALNIVSDHKSWLHLRTDTHTHTFQTQAHSHTHIFAFLHCLMQFQLRAGVSGTARGPDTDKCTLYLVAEPERWDASRALQPQQQQLPQKTTTQQDSKKHQEKSLQKQPRRNHKWLRLVNIL